MGLVEAVSFNVRVMPVVGVWGGEINDSYEPMLSFQGGASEVFAMDSGKLVTAPHSVNLS